MKNTGWKWLTLVGVGTAVAAFTGCDEQSARENSRQVGREVGEAARDIQEGAREAAKGAHGAAQEATQGFREGVGGSGAPDAGSSAGEPVHIDND